jgi:hypothetical protein
MTSQASGDVKLIGLEIDVMWPIGTRVADGYGSGGLFINAFNTNHGGPAIQLGAVGPGTAWDNGLAISGVTGAAVFVEGGTSIAPNALIDTRLPGHLGYGSAAIRVGNENNLNNQRILFEGANGSAGEIALDRTDSLHLSSPARVVMSTNSIERFTLDAKGVVFLAETAGSPTSNPRGGGYLYVEGGALKYRGASGAVTTLAPR